MNIAAFSSILLAAAAPGVFLPIYMDEGVASTEPEKTFLASLPSVFLGSRGGYLGDRSTAYYRDETGNGPTIFVHVREGETPLSLSEMRQLQRSQFSVKTVLQERLFSSRRFANAEGFYGEYVAGSRSSFRQKWLLQSSRYRITITVISADATARKTVLDSVNDDLLGGVEMSDIPSEVSK